MQDINTEMIKMEVAQGWINWWYILDNEGNVVFNGTMVMVEEAQGWIQCQRHS